MKTAIQYIVALVLIAQITACNRKEPQPLVEKPDTLTTESINYHALVIGVSDYSGTDWPNLTTASDDAKAIGNLLSTRYGFKVTELTNKQATRGNILRALDQLMQLTDKDALLIYFAGHGFYDKQMDEGYWIPSGAKRERENLPAKEDWLWNSSINRVINALSARHVLLIADTCYGGSLFRGEENNGPKSDNWYQRAMAVPSRYLITSGNLEPVLDSGIRHSVFAQQILNYLEYTDENVFSASDVAIAIRSRVSQLTGQLVRMGPLASPLNAGGEFVFVRNDTFLPCTEIPDIITSVVPTQNNPATRGPLEDLTNQIESYSRNTSPDDFVRPRVLACLGPSGGNQELTALVRTRLNENLNRIGGCIVVERESFEELLEEGKLGRSELADSRATTRIGKLLPASLILFGDILPAGNLQEIHLRIVDTETSRVLSSSSASFENYEELDSVCSSLASKIMKTMNNARPLLLKTHSTTTGTLLAGWGRFHGARKGDVFEIITREAEGTVSQRDVTLGTAHLLVLEEESSEFQADWNPEATNHPVNLWLKAAL